jgi:YVTN family beta-propeller protein
MKYSNWSIPLTFGLMITVSGLLFLSSLEPTSAHTNSQYSSYASSTIAITQDGSVLVVVNSDSNTITLIDPTVRAVIAELEVGTNPHSVAITSDGLVAYVSNQNSSSITVIDLSRAAVIATLAVGYRPAGVAVSPNGNMLAVAEMGQDTVRFIEASTYKSLSQQSVIDRPYGLAFTPDGTRLLVTHLLSGQVTVLPVLPYPVFLPLVGNPSPEKEGDEPPPTTTAINMPGSIISTWPQVAPAPGVTVNSTGTRAYLPQTMANGLGLNIQFDTTVFPKVSVLDLELLVHATSEHISLPETDRPVGLPWAAALAKDDLELWVVNSASNNVSIIDIQEPRYPKGITNVSLGANPRGIVFNPDETLAYVNNTLSGTVSVIDTHTYQITDQISVTEIPLPPVLLHGKRLFFSSAAPELTKASWISCNTCHIEGEHDGRNWLLQFLGEEPYGSLPVIKRNTTSLLGMIQTYPLRWSAEWDESADSEFSIRFEQFGTGLIPGEMYPTLGMPNQGRSYDLDCLAAYIDSLLVPKRSHFLTETEQRGKTIFESPQTQCAVCHPSPLFTDLQVHDVGTANEPEEWFGPLIDTPTLRFLYDSAPYLHDGRAATLFDMLVTYNVGDQHGVTSLLTDNEIEDLIAFMLILPYEEAQR